MSPPRSLKKNPFAYTPHLQTSDLGMAKPMGAVVKPTIRTTNSNARIRDPALRRPETLLLKPTNKAQQNFGLNSSRLQERMIARLRQKGINDPRVLAAMQAVPRHIFVQEGFASHAYEDQTLPIGFSQTISQPSVVARMLSVVIQGKQTPRKVLEIGTGCGYQAAVMARLFKQVYSIERIKGLYDLAKKNLASLGGYSNSIDVRYGDGCLGLPQHAPFDAIVLAAAGIEVPPTLLDQLAIGGRLIAPVGDVDQHLVLIERESHSQWKEKTLESIHFVPLLAGVQT